MIFTVPLDKNIHTINFLTYTSLNDISAIHVKSEQSIHFTGTLPEDIYPFVYTGKSKGHRKWHGYTLDTNMIETKGDKNEVDALVFGDTDACMILVKKSFVKQYLQSMYGDDDFNRHLAFNTYQIGDKDLELFIDIHRHILEGKQVSNEEIESLLFQILQNPIQDKACLPKDCTLVQTAISSMKNHIKNPILIKELCKDLGVSIRTLEMAFNKHLSITPKVYYKRLLLLTIEAELRNKKTINISNVLQEYEIYNLSQFGASFKHYFSKTPSEIKRLSEDENPFGWNEKIFLEFE